LLEAGSFGGYCVLTWGEQREIEKSAFVGRILADRASGSVASYYLCAFYGTARLVGYYAKKDRRIRLREHQRRRANSDCEETG
jgi:hypothetical protein